MRSRSSRSTAGRSSRRYGASRPAGPDQRPGRVRPGTANFASTVRRGALQSGPGGRPRTDGLVDNVTRSGPTLPAHDSSEVAGVTRSMRMPLARARDPFWDLDGDGARRVRRKRVAVSVGILAVAVVLLLFVWGVPGVRAAAKGVNLDQWASKDIAWQNGNLNGNNSRYPEGGIVPFRLAMEGMSGGSPHIHIKHDSHENGHKGADFLATWNVTNAAGKTCAASGGAISSMCPSMPSS